MTSNQKAKAEAIAGEMMALLNYPLSSAEESLPCVPLNLSQSQLKTAIAPADIKFSDRVKQIYNFIASERTLNAKANLLRESSAKKVKRIVKA